MSETTQPASADSVLKVEQVLVTPTGTTTAAVPPASDELPVEQWDKDRAAATIKTQRQVEKELRAQLKDYERLKAEEQKRQEASMTKEEALQRQLAELQSRTVQYESELMRRDVISQTGLPPEFAERLRGSTREELLADAEALKKLLPQAPKQSVVQSPTNPNGAAPNETEQQKRERLFGRQGNIYDINEILARGGGVVVHSKE